MQHSGQARPTHLPFVHQTSLDNQLIVDKPMPANLKKERFVKERRLTASLELTEGVG